MTQCAIVLQGNLNGKYALLGEQHGRIDVFYFTRPLNISVLIHYHVNRTLNRTLVIDHVNVVQMPLALARQDLLFIHHVIELCYQFIPIGSSIEGIFELLQFLYTVEDGWTRKCKKMFVLKLLAMIGYYPEYNVERVKQWIDKPLFSADTLSSSEEQEVDEWLIRCIANHPRIALFKTLRFLQNCEPL